MRAALARLPIERRPLGRAARAPSTGRGLLVGSCLPAEPGLKRPLAFCCVLADGVEGRGRKASLDVLRLEFILGFELGYGFDVAVAAVVKGSADPVTVAVVGAAGGCDSVVLIIVASAAEASFNDAASAATKIVELGGMEVGGMGNIIIVLVKIVIIYIGVKVEGIVKVLKLTFCFLVS